MFLTIAYILLVSICILAWKFLPKYEPNKLFIFLWTIQIALGSLFFIGSYQFTGYLFLYVAIISIILFFSSFLAKRCTHKIDMQNIEYNFSQNRTVLILIVSIMMAIIYPFIILGQNGIHIGELFSKNGLIEINFKMAELRYSNNLEMSKWAQPLLAILYFLPLYAGFVFNQLHHKWRWLCFMPCIPVLLILLTINTKVIVVSSILLWFCGWLCSAIYRKFPLLKHFGWKKITIVACSVIALISILILSLMLRAGDFDLKIAKIAKRKFEVYTFGHLPATDKWLFTNGDSLSFIDNQFGKSVFIGISAPLNLAEKKQGLYKKHTTYSHYLRPLPTKYEKKYRTFEGVEIPEGIDSTIVIEINGVKYHKMPLHTNVYTLFRPAIEDFGIIGSVVFFFLVGFIGSNSYYFLRKKRFVFLSLTILASCYFFYLFYFASAWSYTSFVAAFALFYIAIKISFIKKREHEILPE